MPPCKFVNADTSMSDDFFKTQTLGKSGIETDIKHDYVTPTLITNLDAIETLSNTTELSIISENELRKSGQLMYKNERLKHLSKRPSKFTTGLTDQTGILTKQNIGEGTITKYLSNVDHVYEEVNAHECDIMDYYEKYSPTTAKTLINTLFLPRHKICKQCANLQGSPVYSDQLIYAKKPLYAREVHLFQQNDTLQFKYCSKDGKYGNSLYLQYDNVQHCLLIHNCLKSNAGSIFYYYGPPRDIFDLKTLKPNILLINNNGTSKEVVNTELYHRYVSNFDTRISKNGVTPTAFHVNHDNILSSIKHVGYDTDLQNWINYRNDVFGSHSLKQDDAIDHRANRSSLLLLEPLLLMPELGSSRYRHGKNRISQSEHVKVVKIAIAYTISFFILASITFYIVYFT
ncbi:unnamed protein product [Xylocopa violacea]|uniref:Uncharacterized protein n=1 Tax=Xylocopa violacea TaxID=135666 RepID=A0ABP1PHC3_XYLVO